MDRQMDGQIDGRIDIWMNRQIDGWIDRQMDEWIDRKRDEQIDGWIYRWMKTYMDRKIYRGQPLDDGFIFQRKLKKNVYSMEIKKIHNNNLIVYHYQTVLLCKVLKIKKKT